jgi:hypothetical protein
VAAQAATAAIRSPEWLPKLQRFNLANNKKRGTGVRTKEVLLSDWTLSAFMQREEERRRKEQAKVAVIQTQKEMQRTEPLRSEWTIAALQQRFSALEQRIAALEQIVGEQRRNEQAEAASIAPGEETPRSDEMLLNNPVLVGPKGVHQPARFAEAESDDGRLDAAGPAGEQRLTLDATKTLRLDTTKVAPDEAAHIKPARKKAHGVIWFMITALTAGALGFGAAIYVVPIQKAIHYQALAKHGLNSIYRGLQTPVKQ